MATPVTAQENSAASTQGELANSFNIPAQPLRDALRQLTRQGGPQVTFEASEVEGKTSSAVTGNMGSGEALSRLLAGTGLTFRYVTSGAAVLEPAPDADAGTVQLGPVRVQADAGRSVAIGAAEVTEGSNSYTTTVTSAATRLPLSLRETPQSATVITRQRMDDQQLNSVREVLENTTGVSAVVTDTERVAFYARGREITGYQYDGIPTVDVITTSSLPVFTPSDSLLDTISYDRVEVVRGAAGLLSGWGNPSASINLVRKRPTPDFALSASVSAGSWNNYRGTVDISAPLTSDGRVRARVAGAYHDKQSYMDFYKQRRHSVYGILEADLTSTTTASIGYEYQDAKPKGAMWGGLPIFYSDGSAAVWPRSKNFGARWNRWDNKTETVFARLESRFGEWTVKANYTHRDTAAEAELYTVLGNPNRVTGSLMTGVALAESMNGKQDSVDVMAEGPFELFGRRHELVIGGLWSQRESHSPRALTVIVTPTANANTWDGNIPRPDFAALPKTITDYDHEQTGIYGAVRLSLADPLKLILGARVSSYQVRQDAGGRLSRYKDSGRLLPYAGVTFDLDGSHSIYASYTRIFSPQTQGMRDKDENVLPPTTGNNAEIGIKGEYFDGRLNASIALFDNRLDNVPQIDPDHRLSDGTTAWKVARGTKSRGIDVDVQGEIMPGWNLFAGVSHFKAKTDQGTRLSSEVPRTTARLFTTYRLPGNLDGVTIGGGVNWQSRFYTTLGTVGDVGQGSYALVSLMARYDITDGTTIAINANNLFDKSYYTQVGLFNQYLYGEPRSVMVTLSQKF